MRMSLVPVTLMLSSLMNAGVSARSAATPFDLLDDGSVVVAVTIGGAGPYRFVVDTGSSRTVISERLWRELRLPVLAKTRVITPAGQDEAYVVRLANLALTGRLGITVNAAVLPADRYAAGQQVDGLIGQDVLLDAVYTIDYRLRDIVWHSPNDMPIGVRIPIEVRDRRVLAHLAQYPGDPTPLSLVPDTGSDALVLFAHAQRKVRSTPLDVGVLTSVTGRRLAQRVQLDDLIVGQARLENPLAVVIDSNEPADVMGDGLLPLHSFSSVTFNVAGGFLIVQ
jgi:predicted aspartyl protease